MNGIYDYLTESERATMIEEINLENESENIMLEFAICDMKHEAAIRNIDTAALINNYNESTLVELYIKEAESTTAAKKSLWQKFKDWIKKILKKISNIITGGNNDVDPDATVSMKKSDLEVIETATKNKSKLKKVGTIAGIVAAAGILTAIGIKVGKNIFDKHKEKTGNSVSQPAETETDQNKPAESNNDDMVEVKAAFVQKLKNELNDLAQGISADCDKLQDSDMNDANAISAVAAKVETFCLNRIAALQALIDKVNNSKPSWNRTGPFSKTKTEKDAEKEIENIRKTNEEYQKKAREAEARTDNTKMSREERNEALGWKTESVLTESFDELLALINAL